MAKPAVKWLTIASVTIGFTASGAAQDATQRKTELPQSNTPFAARWSQNIDLREKGISIQLCGLSRHGWKRKGTA